MSGKTKRILYHICDWTLWAAAIAGIVLLVLFSAGRIGRAELIAFSAVIVCVLLRLPAAVHECGHLLFGAFAGLKFHAATISYLRFTEGRPPQFVWKPERYAGSAEMFPTGGDGVRGRMIAFTLGGAVCNLMVGGIALLLYFLLPYHAALFFFALLAPLMLYEGVRALLPATLPAGKTDGAVLVGLLKRSPEEEVALRVLTAQGILFRREFSHIPRELLFEAPVVQEDVPAFQALLLLRAQYLLSEGDEEGARAQLDRLLSVEDLPQETADAAARWESLLNGEEVPAQEGLYGVTRLEEALGAQKNKNSAGGAE